MSFYGGFTADVQGIKDLAAVVHDCADQVRDVVKGLRGLPVANEDSLGDGGALNAYTSFFGAWTDELTIIAASLDEFCQKLKDTAENYHANEWNLSVHFQSIGLPQ